MVWQDKPSIPFGNWTPDLKGLWIYHITAKILRTREHLTAWLSPSGTLPDLLLYILRMVTALSSTSIAISRHRSVALFYICQEPFQLSLPNSFFQGCTLLYGSNLRSLFMPGSTVWLGIFHLVPSNPVVLIECLVWLHIPVSFPL